METETSAVRSEPEGLQEGAVAFFEAIAQAMAAGERRFAVTFITNGPWQATAAWSIDCVRAHRSPARDRW